MATDEWLENRWRKKIHIGRKFQELPNSFTEGRKLTDLSSRPIPWQIRQVWMHHGCDRPVRPSHLTVSRMWRICPSVASKCVMNVKGLFFCRIRLRHRCDRSVRSSQGSIRAGPSWHPEFCTTLNSIKILWSPLFLCTLFFQHKKNNCFWYPNSALSARLARERIKD